MATHLGYKLTEVRKNGKLWWLRPDGKTQVTIEYLQKVDGSVEPQKIHTVLISTQHAEPSKAVRSKECAGYSGPEMTAPSMEDMNKAIVEDVVKATLKEIILKNGQPAITLFGDHTHCTSIPPVSSSSVVPRAMQVSLDAKLSSIHTEAGVLMVVALSLARTQPRWTALQLTFAGRWPSPL
jgi:hypothetical protein